MDGPGGTLARADLRVLVCEKIADAGIAYLAERFTVDDGLGLSREELLDRVGDYDALVVRSATKVTADLIGRADRLKVVGRAGTGVDNVDVDAATRRGIVVCNAAGSNALSAAEHAIALLLAQARNIPQAHASLVEGRWERSRFGGIEVTGQDARRARLRAHRPDGGRARQGPRHARRRLRPPRRRGPLPRARGGEGGHARGPLPARATSSPSTWRRRPRRAASSARRRSRR